MQSSFFTDDFRLKVGLAEMLKGSDVKICTVIGFPHGAHQTAIKVAEATRSIGSSAASRSIGARSQTVASPSIWSITAGFSTKKPPLIQPPSPRGFSIKPLT